MEINDRQYEPDIFCIQQNNKFLSQNFQKPDITPKNVQSAKKKIKTTATKAENSIKANRRTPISFATKALFCYKVEKAGMTRRSAWNHLKAHGYQVGQSHGSCHKWAEKGAHHWMSLIARYGDGAKLSKRKLIFIYLIIFIINCKKKKKKIKKKDFVRKKHNILFLKNVY